MAISYPLTMPTLDKLVSVDVSHVNVTSLPRSPFTGQGDVFSWPAERRQATVRLRPLSAGEALEWIGFLTSLRGRFGSFLMGDCIRQSANGTATTLTVTGSAGARTVTGAANGTLAVGDMFSLGTGEDARLHEVLAAYSGTGDMEIWPSLRADYTTESADLTAPQGVWRLMSDEQNWSISAARRYGISFAAEEDI